MPQRKIIHIDMDAFYASVEQRDDPSLRGRPIAVGHDGPRGVVSTASYEARPYGVRSALPSVTARRLCPELIFVPARFDVYKAVSQQIRDIFREYTELVEPLSLDEAFLDVTHERSATLVAREIKARIRRQTELTASAGVSVNKMLAKIASDYRKPDGLFTIAPSEVEAFVAALPVERFFGIGAVTAERMHRMGIHTGADLRQWDEAALVQRFGKAGHAYYGYARGVDEREVEPHRVRKSVGAETTFAEDTDDRHTAEYGAGSRARGGVEPHSASRVPGQDRRAETQIRRLPPDHPIEDALHGHRLRRSALPRIGGAARGRRFPRPQGAAHRPHGGQHARSLCRLRAVALRLRRGVTVSSVLGEVLSRELFRCICTRIELIIRECCCSRFCSGFVPAKRRRT